ncbi:proteasome assembly chaperone 2 [Ischnura elegans]|uniref:proteasome assembly chaperone 2 n=1 Tax=Ischnura elegans TaxID=197161 RepID=UPI001ED886AE|nr:proteasome assembly chaperone 2 [Ischnura elegans]
MFYPVYENSSVNYDGCTVIVPSISIGNVPQLAVDLLVSSLKPALIGYIHHENLIPVVGANAYDEKSREISTSCEVYYLKNYKIVLLQVRGAVVPGCEKKFCQDLTDWIKSINAKKVAVLMSISAEIRRDKDLSGCQIRYALPSALKAELENKLIGHGLSEYDGPGKNESPSSRDVDKRMYVPSGGFGQHLYDIGNRMGVPNLGMMMFAYEGDNESEAFTLAEAVANLCDLKVQGWKKPVSWALLYGSGPPPEIY